MAYRCTVRHILASCLVAALGCGSRSDVGQLDLAPERTDAATRERDAGAPRPRRDAGRPPRPDASTPDAGIPDTCTVVAGETRTMFVDDGGSFDRPQAVYRGGTFDLLASFYPETDDRRPVPYGSRFDERLEPAGGLSGGGDVSGPQHAAARGDWLGICATGFGDGLVWLSGFPGDTADFGVPVVRGTCHDLAGNGDRWLVVYQEEIGPGWWYQLRDETGDPVTWGAPLRTLTDVEVQGATATAFGDGFAWALSPDSSRRLEVGFLDADGVHRAVEIEDVFPAIAPPAIAPWPYDPEGAVAVVHHDLGGVTLRVVDADSGEVRLHTEPFAFSMGGDVTPALVRRPDGLVVAMLSYGDFVPTNGLIEIVVIGPRGEETSRYTAEANRWNLVHGGIDATTDGDTIVVHWADVEGDTGGEIVPVTRAMTLRCD